MKGSSKGKSKDKAEGGGNSDFNFEISDERQMTRSKTNTEARIYLVAISKRPRFAPTECVGDERGAPVGSLRAHLGLRFVDDVERRFSGAAEAGESGGSDDLADARFAGLRA